MCDPVIVMANGSVIAEGTPTEVQRDQRFSRPTWAVGSMALLEASAVVAGYGETEILHGVSITVNKGEVVTIIGPNGCGKSTLMKAIVGLVRVRNGSVQFRGVEISGTTRSRLYETVCATYPRPKTSFHP